MTGGKGPITVITSLSEERNRWKAMAFAWKSVASQAMTPCSECGTPALWRSLAADTYWCEVHRDLCTDGVEKAPWYEELKQALRLEDDV